MCFNVIIGNRDDHARNFAFIYDKEWHFAPAYDLLPCGTAGDYHTTSVNDNPLPQREDCLRLAEKVGIDTKYAERIFREIENMCSGREKVYRYAVYEKSLRNGRFFCLLLCTHSVT